VRLKIVEGWISKLGLRVINIRAARAYYHER
jgi:hypothetical protein